jgi:hypothetical protein
MAYVLFLDLRLLFGREVVDDVEELANFFRCLSLDHVRDGLTTNVTVWHSSVRPM